MKKMKRLTDSIKAFRPLLKELDLGNNLVLGGAFALQLHGLKLAREPEDLDIIIYSPTPRQLKILMMLLPLMVAGSSSTERRSFKLISSREGKKDIFLDLLIMNKPVPKNLLTFNCEEGEYRAAIQSIDNILQAKWKYSRIKDLNDLIDLKSNNPHLELEYNVKTKK